MQGMATRSSMQPKNVEILLISGHIKKTINY